MASKNSINLSTVGGSLRTRDAWNMLVQPQGMALKAGQNSSTSPVRHDSGSEDLTGSGCRTQMTIMFECCSASSCVEVHAGMAAKLGTTTIVGPLTGFQALEEELSNNRCKSEELLHGSNAKSYTRAGTSIEFSGP